MKKRIISAFLTAVLIAAFIPNALAYEPPKSIWASFNKYSEAIEANDHENIIKYGLIDLSILENEPSNETVDSWICARYQKIGEAYEALGDYQKSAEMFEKQIPYAQKCGWDDSVKIAKAKSKNFRSDIMLFETTNETQKYYGALNEHEKGILYGVVADSPYDQSQCSMKLIYLEYGNTEFDWINAELRAANERGMAVELAFNMPNQGYDIPRVLNGDEYINLVADMLAQYPNVKFFFRFGAEFDIWETPADPEEYKAAFIKTANIIRSKVKNAAMVFSPSMVPSWNINIRDYYPGDEYVDWIGMSFYMMKYFLGEPNRDASEKYLEIVFGTSESSQPVLLAAEVINALGVDKPVMLSESGASHYIHSIGEDATPWAMKRLEQMYKYLPMVYPQIKLIAHFDIFIQGETNDYSLRNNSQIQNLYTELTSSPIYIKESAKNTSDVAYKKLEDVIYVDGSPLELNTYVQVYGKDDFTVNYYIDGEWIASSNQIPYTRTIDTSAYTYGEHTLTVSAEAGGQEVYQESYKLVGSDAPAVNNESNNEIKVTIDGNELSFDQSPIIVDGRTLVPMRAIFEALGAEVTWDETTKTATGTTELTTVSIAIGSNTLYKNNEPIALDVPAQLVNERTLVPVRAISESFGYFVDWDETTRTVIILTK